MRKYWGDLQGKVPLNQPWEAINVDSVVLISVSEYTTQDPHNADYHRFTGEADITVQNISPYGPPYTVNSGVSFYVNINWSQPIPIVTDIIVLPNPSIVAPPASITMLSSSTASATQKGPTTQTTPTDQTAPTK
jgi:hypothetical protein